MLLSIIILALLAGVVYFHYAQGLFSATLSAALAMVAACLAIGQYEVVVSLLPVGRLVDYAPAAAMAGVFGIVYGVGRVVFDALAPGNLRFPSIVDKVGGAVMGLIAGMFGTGVFAIAAQSLPVGPSILGLSRFELVGTREVRIPTRGQALDARVRNELKADALRPEDRAGLLIPVDSFVLGFVRALSDGGSLAGATPFEAVHPNLLDQFFGQRIGVQTGALRTAINDAKRQQARVAALFVLPSLSQADGEAENIRKRNLPLTLKPSASDVLLVVRTLFNLDASDDDKLFRFSPASVRLVAGGVNHHPIGALDDRGILRVNRPDDFLFVNVAERDRGADLVFLLPRADLFTQETVGYNTEARPPVIRDGVFLEVKRQARTRLAGMDLKFNWTKSDEVGLVRKENLPEPEGLPQRPVDAPLTIAGIELSPRLPIPLHIGPHGDEGEVQFDSGRARLRQGRLAWLSLNDTRTIQVLQRGDNPVRELFAGEGRQILQMAMAPAAARDGDPWGWSDRVGQFELVDENERAIRPAGAIVQIKQGTQDKLVAEFEFDRTIGSFPRYEGRPTDVWLVYVVPDNTRLVEVRYEGKRLRSIATQIGG